MIKHFPSHVSKWIFVGLNVELVENWCLIVLGIHCSRKYRETYFVSVEELVLEFVV